jgi:hypothetical protein
MPDSNTNSLSIGSQSADIPAEVFIGQSKDPANYRLDTYNTRTAIGVLNIPDSMFLDDAYSGQGGFLNGKYLVPHVRESDYNRRRQLAYYRNFLRPIVRAKVDPVFNEPIPRLIDGDKDTEHPFNSFIEDSDYNGTTLQSFMIKAALDSVLKGVSFIVMDSPADQPQTMKEAEDARAFPYVYSRARAMW